MVYANTFRIIWARKQCTSFTLNLAQDLEHYRPFPEEVIRLLSKDIQKF